MSDSSDLDCFSYIPITQKKKRLFVKLPNKKNKQHERTRNNTQSQRSTSGSKIVTKQSLKLNCTAPEAKESEPVRVPVATHKYTRPKFNVKKLGNPSTAGSALKKVSATRNNIHTINIAEQEINNNIGDIDESTVQQQQTATEFINNWIGSLPNYDDSELVSVQTGVRDTGNLDTYFEDQPTTSTKVPLQAPPLETVNISIDSLPSFHIDDINEPITSASSVNDIRGVKRKFDVYSSSKECVSMKSTSQRGIDRKKVGLKLRKRKLEDLKSQSFITSFFKEESKPPILEVNAISDVEDTKNIKCNNCDQRAKTLWHPLLSRMRSKSYIVASDSDSSSTGSKPHCPITKKIPGIPFVVDAFSYGYFPDVRCYFLSHYHSDHYKGLGSRWNKMIYCSQITSNLITSQLKVQQRFITVLQLNRPVDIHGVQVTCFDAKHCPGAFMFLFECKNGSSYLHVGDFRACSDMEYNDAIFKYSNNNLTCLYLDTTFCSPKYVFPTQKEVVDWVGVTVKRLIQEDPKTLFVCGTYTIGKEQIFLSVINALGGNCGVWASSKKWKILDCLDTDDLKRIRRTTQAESSLYITDMWNLSYKCLHSILESHGSTFSRIVAFRATGWECKGDMNNNNVHWTKTILPKSSCHGRVLVYGVPYSEHSSYSELRQFVQFLQPKKIIPTANANSNAQRESIKKIISKWVVGTTVQFG